VVLFRSGGKFPLGVILGAAESSSPLTAVYGGLKAEVRIGAGPAEQVPSAVTSMLSTSPFHLEMYHSEVLSVLKAVSCK
jgi:hypothetical protein